MIIPIGTDNPLRRTPMANYVLIGLNFVIFLYTYSPHAIGYGVSEPLREVAQPYKLYPQQPQLHQFVTYAFLHGSWMHIIGNMLFLYIFGNNVNDKLGNIGYLLLYLGGAVFSGLLHCIFEPHQVIGASGAVAAITGAYMVLYPKTNIHVLYVIIFIGTLEISALYFILFKLIVIDNVLPELFIYPDNIARKAHLAGYAFGIAVPLVMLAWKLLPRSQYDLWSLIDRGRRRRQYKKTVRQGFDPFGIGGAGRKSVDVTVTDSQPADARSQKIRTLRTEISTAINSTQLDEAAEKFLQLIEIDPEQVLTQQQQLDIANKLMQIGKHDAAAAAYETFLNHYQKQYPFIEQIELMLGLIYSRYMNQKEPARKHLQLALEKLTDSNQKKMCRDELDRLDNT